LGLGLTFNARKGVEIEKTTEEGQNCMIGKLKYN
jgi:hypothetical protein